MTGVRDLLLGISDPLNSNPLPESKEEINNCQVTYDFPTYSQVR